MFCVLFVSGKEPEYNFIIDSLPACSSSFLIVEYYYLDRKFAVGSFKQTQMPRSNKPEITRKRPNVFIPRKVSADSKRNTSAYVSNNIDRIIRRETKGA